jgi:hypothetical protein
MRQTGANLWKIRGEGGEVTKKCGLRKGEEEA